VGGWLVRGEHSQLFHFVFAWELFSLCLQFSILAEMTKIEEKRYVINFAYGEGMRIHYVIDDRVQKNK
jgi:hypothetical protein